MNAVTIIRTPEKLGLRVEDYLRLARAGAYDGYGKTELIEGDVYAMNAQYSRHARIKTRLAVALTHALVSVAGNLEALVEVSVALSDDSMPEPDISVTSYQGNDPTPASSIALIVEVADTTLAIDLGRKAALYARHGIPEYWVLDVDAGILHQMWEPGNAGFAQVRRTPFGNLLMAATLDNLTIATTDF
jgi:Uma2 family endonuclease